MFAVLSRFTIANDMMQEVREAFRNRPHQVDHAPGFLRMEVMSPLGKPEEIWLTTWWRDEPSFDAWHKSHAYQESHRGMPKGLKLVPRSTEIRRFEIVAQ